MENSKHPSTRKEKENDQQENSNIFERATKSR